MHCKRQSRRVALPLLLSGSVLLGFVQRLAFFGFNRGKTASASRGSQLRGHDSPPRAALVDERLASKVDLSDTRSPGIKELERLVHNAKLIDIPSGLLQRCYKASKERVPQAFGKVREIVRWREREQVDQILANPSALEDELWYRRILHYGLPGQDKKGRGVMIEAVGQWDMEALDKGARERRDTMLRSHVVVCETLSRQSQGSEALSNGQPPGFVAVLDMKGISLKQNPMSYSQVLDALRDISKINARYYPEAIEHIFVVNTPSVFQTIWRLVAPFVLPSSGVKVDVLREGDFGTLVRECGTACLPVQLGGELPANTAPYDI